MKTFERRHFVASLGGTLALGSCASANPNLYTIAPVSGPTLNASPKIIVLRGIGVARYLVRREIVRSSENYRVDVTANDWWAEPIDSMLGRVLVQELGQRLPQSTIYQATGAVSASPDASIEIELQRLDLDEKGQLVLVAQAAVSFDNRAPVARRGFRITMAPTSTSIAGQVGASSAAFGQMADGVAEMLTRKPSK